MRAIQRVRHGGGAKRSFETSAVRTCLMLDGLTTLAASSASLADFAGGVADEGSWGGGGYDNFGDGLEGNPDLGGADVGLVPHLSTDLDGGLGDGLAGPSTRAMVTASRAQKVLAPEQVHLITGEGLTYITEKYKELGRGEVAQQHAELRGKFTHVGKSPETMISFNGEELAPPTPNIQNTAGPVPPGLVDRWDAEGVPKSLQALERAVFGCADTKRRAKRVIGQNGSELQIYDADTLQSDGKIDPNSYESWKPHIDSPAVCAFTVPEANAALEREQTRNKVMSIQTQAEKTALLLESSREI